jgi:hypothetical protein
MDLIKRYKIILSLITSLALTLVVTQTIFFAGVPKINKEKINRTIKDTKDNLTIFKNTFAYKMSPKKIDYNQVLSSDGSADVPEMEFEEAPIISPTVVPTEIPTLTPTSVPTTIPTPTEIILTKATPTVRYLLATVTPTVKKKPTATPIPEPEPTSKPVANSLKISNPLDQPYYKPGLAYKCYNADKFIEVYGGGANPGSCYTKVQSYVSSHLTSVSILGKSISIHKDAYPAFKAVSDELNKSSVAKKYKINTIGAYVFRCNVNASTSDRNDLCSDGCVLSAHAFGIAVDINWDENCNGCSNYTIPMEIVDIFESYGFRWGGRYKSVFGSRIDAMHFEYMYDLCKDIN